MNHVGRVREVPPDAFEVTDVGILKVNPAGYCQEVCHFAGRKVVNHAYVFPAPHEFLHHMRADEARSPSDQIRSHLSAFLLELG